ncbi:MAG: NAD-dependent epimerase/dehydratase family protein [Gemmatimonadota bacterium]
MASRRRFLKVTATMAAAAGTGLLPPFARAADAISPGLRAPGRRQPLRVLVLGGTGFIGPHLVRTLLERGHTPTLFNRGRTEPAMFAELFPGLENRIGDRNGDISSLEQGEWDAVVDDSGYTPQQVAATAQSLRGRVGQYLFTSTRAVYTDYTAERMDEDAPLGMRGVPESEWDGYGPLKVLAEREVTAAFPDAATIVRPAIITGPGDRTDRFTYWYVRIDEGGDVLVPGSPSDPVQYIDVRDLASFYVHLLEQGTTGVFNLEAPAAPLSAAEFVHGIRAITAGPVAFTWADWGFLDGLGLRGGEKFAAWRAPAGDWLNYGRMDNSRALAAGLTVHPLADTARDTLIWWRGRSGSGPSELGSGPTAAEEREALGAWRSRNG